ncbi:high affinity cAMP-specific and IBMX-insensitive 3',5'-cyclic phosphodiesterase 8B-like [Physella acuta]|uniref:high affinity cAMP-specific and IBMX-insensitive 3',5'-cyclic phosphodiesterase 8B-like n=1 Tax=Physella acuta TaxID=109671 RepID=UPI0027DE1556|nr:high affinity cAMP-specific and IBMX-insensitive 3',5'-cyclic phosphodiesterase 8B-like [Physella acuta]
MGCTPSIHVSQTGVVYCRESEDSNSPHPSSLNATFHAAHAHVIRGDTSVTTVVGEDHVLTTTTTACTTSTAIATVSSSRSFGKANNRTSNASNPGGLCVSLSEAETQTSRQSMKNLEHLVKFGPMLLKQKAMSVLLVFGKEDGQSDGFWWAAEKLGYRCNIAGTPENALETYLKYQYDVVVIDARSAHHNSFDAEALCRSIKATKASEFTVLVAVTKRYCDDKEEPSILPLLQAGFTRRYQENSSLSACINELQTLEVGEVRANLKLQACNGLFMAMENIGEAVEITSSEHEIQFVNHAYERLCGYTSEDILGRDSNELFRCDKNRETIESINGHMKKGKHWEGTYYTRRKSGDTIPFHCKVTPILGPAGSISQFVSVKSHSTESYNQVVNGNMMSFPRRRESVVRAHSMTIEAPITKVINIINAAQENSPLTVAQALDKVLEILQTSELYSPFQHQEMGENDDPMASDLVEGLMSQNVKRKLSGHDIQRALHHSHGHHHIPSTPACSLSQIPEPIMNVLNLDVSWDFDIITLEKLTNKRPLLHLGLKIFARFGVCEYLNINETCLVNWLQMIESNYHANNFYHNSTHAADVLHATAYFLDRERSKEIFDQQDQVTSLIAAVVHDVDHPARTNAFLINEKHQLAILYNDQAVLENHHASMCFRLTHKDQAVDIFKNLSSDDYKTVRQSIIDQVLATDMKQHFEHLSKFTTSVTKHLQKLEGDNTDVEAHEADMNTILSDLSLHENRVLIKRMMIKCADVSNPLRPLPLCKEWAYRIAEEYCQQTDEEKSRGLPVVMAQFDRKTLNIPKCQLAFINLFITTMFDAWDVYCDIPDLMHHLQLNYDYWKAQEVMEKDPSAGHNLDNS